MKLRLTRRALLAVAGAAALDACASSNRRGARLRARSCPPESPELDDAGAVDDAEDAGTEAVADASEAAHDASDAALDASALVLDPAGIFDLRAGYTYAIVQRRGEAMSDGYRVPGRPDGMACFGAEDGAIIVMRNHEIRDAASEGTPYFAGQSAPLEAYDAATAYGGVTRMVLDADTLELRSSNLVLAGTSWNCAGGVSPFGWLSCEEVTRAGHGYVFACDPNASRVQPWQRIEAYGRYRHEAATVDPDTMIAYLTEDEHDACFYRFLPASREQPFEGVLQALCVHGRPRFDTGLQHVGERLEIDWVDIDVPDPGPLDPTVRAQAQAKGAAIFRRTEGMWLAGDELFLSASTGGALAAGQILRLGLGREPGLEVLVESCDPRELLMPDNLCVSPHGALYVAEDNGRVCHLRRVLRDGTIEAFGRNAASHTEIAGPCFSLDGRTLFLNLQEEGLTLAIRGPFDRDLVRDGGTSAAVRSQSAHGLARVADAAFRRRTLA